MVTELLSLRESWELRNAATTTLVKAEKQMRRLLEPADCEQIVTLLEAFSPGRSPGPEWTRTFEPLTERLWLWCDPAELAKAEAVLRARGPAWQAIANSLLPDQGAEIRARVQRHSAPSHLPAFSIE
jgi:hypothetical protein